MARRIKLPGLDGLRDLPDSIRRRREPSPGAPEQPAPQASAPPPQPPAPTTPTPPPVPAPDASTPPAPAAPAPASPANTPAPAPATEAPTAGLPPATPPAPDAPGRTRRWRTPALVVLGLLLAAGAGVGAGYLLFENDETASAPIAPTVVVAEGPGEPAADTSSLGFPGFASLNTTRVGGADSTAVAAGAALAAYPSEGEVSRPRLVTLAPSDSWQAGIAASSLTSEGVGGPILLSDPDSVPELTAQALEQLEPAGLERADGAELVAVGDVDTPSGYEKIEVRGDDPAELANAIDEQRAELSGAEHPDHILVVSSKEPELAMPAAAWAARSGDPVAFADGSDVPAATLEMLERHPDAPVYVLGPESAITAKAVATLAAAGGGSDSQQADAPEGERKVVRVGAEDAVENAIEFARFVDGTFGWNINDPGHGFVVANASRPSDAGAAAPLSAAGKPGPLLLTDDAAEVPKALEGFLLDTKPGYVDDPTRAIYNHVWVVGDDAAISVPFQAEVDRLTELTKVSEGTGLPELGPKPGTPEPEPEPDSKPKSSN